MDKKAIWHTSWISPRNLKSETEPTGKKSEKKRSISKLEGTIKAAVNKIGKAHKEIGKLQEITKDARAEIEITNPDPSAYKERLIRDLDAAHEVQMQVQMQKLLKQTTVLGDIAGLSNNRNPIQQKAATALFVAQDQMKRYQRDDSEAYFASRRASADASAKIEENNPEATEPIYDDIFGIGGLDKAPPLHQDDRNGTYVSFEQFKTPEPAKPEYLTVAGALENLLQDEGVYTLSTAPRGGDPTYQVIPGENQTYATIPTPPSANIKSPTNYEPTPKTPEAVHNPEDNGKSFLPGFQQRGNSAASTPPAKAPPPPSVSTMPGRTGPKR